MLGTVSMTLPYWRGPMSVLLWADWVPMRPLKLLTDEPSKIAAVMKIARKTIRIANQNIVFALGVKFLVLILGALGYANMWAAVFADVGVSIIAILNAIRAMRVKLPDMPAGSTNQG